MYKIFYLSILLISFLSFSQTSQTYSGKYLNGEATYRYYENENHERILNGEFKYSSKLFDYSNFEININGNYKDNLKTGIWNSIKTRFVTDIRIGKIKIIETVKGNFIEGKRNGVWTYKKETKEKKNKNSKEISNIVDAKFNFVNDTLIGDINYNGVIGKIDKNGNLIGVWNLKIKDWRNDTEYIAEFNKNIFTKLIIRQISTGEINYKYDNNAIVQKIIDSNEEIITVDNLTYQLKSCEKLDQLWGDNDDKYFIDFVKKINEKINEFESGIKDITLGSTDFILKKPRIVIKLAE